MEFVDSFEVNPNKLMMTAFDCTCMWVRDVLTFTGAFAVDPLYLQVNKRFLIFLKFKILSPLSLSYSIHLKLRL